MICRAEWRWIAATFAAGVLAWYATTAHAQQISAEVPEGKTVFLQFVSPAAIARMKTGKVAVALPRGNLCYVWLPAGMWLWGEMRQFPYHGAFARGRDANIVAHELLHCLIGAWHPE